MKHKPILYDQLRRENRQQRRLSSWIDDHLSWRFTNRMWKIATYNVVMQTLYTFGRIISTLILSAIGSLLLTALLTSATQGQPVADAFVSILHALF